MLIPKPAQWALNISLFLTYWFLLAMAGAFLAGFSGGIMGMEVDAPSFDTLVGVGVLIASILSIYLSAVKMKSLYITKSK